jgi:flotillin
VLASAIVSVGDSDELIKTAANRFFAKRDDEQMSTLTDLLSSSGRRAVNLLTHDQLFSAKSGGRTALLTDREAQVGSPATVSMEEDDDPLAIIIRKACSRELTDLGLVFNSLNIKVVQSEVAEARRRQSAAEVDTMDLVDILKRAGFRGACVHSRSTVSTLSTPSTFRRFACLLFAIREAL